MLWFGFLMLAIGVVAGRRANSSAGDGGVGVFAVLAAVVMGALFLIFAWVDIHTGYDAWLTKIFTDAGEFKTNGPYCPENQFDTGQALLYAIEALFALLMLTLGGMLIVILPPLGAICGFIGALRWMFTGKRGLFEFGGWSLGIGAAMIVVFDLWIRICVATQSFPFGCRGPV